MIEDALKWVPWWAWLVVAACCTTALEVAFRRGTDWALWLVIPPEVVVSYAIYRTLTDPDQPSLLVGLAAFSLGTWVLRALASQFYLGEPLVRGNLAAGGLMVTAILAGRLWR